MGGSKRARALKQIINCDLKELYNARPFTRKPASLFIWGETLYQILLKKELKKISPSHFIKVDYNGTTYYIREVGKQSEIYKNL